MMSLRPFRLQSLGSPELAHHFKADLRAAMFTAALVVVAEKFHFLGLLTKMSLLLVANLATSADNEVVLSGQGPVVAYMQEQHWAARYRAQSPLDRCLLADDIDRMLARKPRTLAVDFDLSPGPAGAGAASEAACQARLDSVLDRNASRLVLLTPVPTLPEFVDGKRAWMMARCAAGVRFGEGALDQSLGAVIDARADRIGLARALRPAGESVCGELRTPASANRWLLRDAVELDEGAHAKAVPINFRGFARATVTLPMDAPELDQIGNWAERDMLFGGDYGTGTDDQFLTPIGKLPGVAIHAAQLWTLDDPVKEASHMTAFVLDVGMAYLFSVAILVFWRGYVTATLAPGWRSQLGPAWVAGFVLVYGVLVALLFDLAVRLFANGVLIAPLLVATVMLFDGFVSGPINAFRHASPAHAAGNPHDGGAAVPAPRPVTGSTLVLAFLFAILLAMAWGAEALHAQPSASLLLPLALAMVALDRSLSARFPARQHDGGAEGRHERWTRFLPGGLIGAGAGALGMAASPLIAPSTIVFGALAGALALPMLCGLLLGMKRPYAAPPGAAGWGRWGLDAPQGRLAWAALALYLTRQTVFWGVLVYATFSMMHH